MDTVDIQALLLGLREVLGPSNKTIPLHEPLFAGNEWELLKDCLDTGWVSSVGKYVDAFENEVAAACGTSHAVAVVNGTAAIHMALMLSGVVPGDEVIVPTLTFVATANAVAYCHAIPHFVDSSSRTLGLDVDKLEEHLGRIGERKADGLYNRETGRRVRAVVPMHTFGHPVDMDRLTQVAAAFGLEVVEDATESLGSRLNGRPTGSFSPLGTLSFNGNKIVTTGGGGAIVTNDPALWKKAKHLTTTAKQPHAWEFNHDEIGYNYRLPNINAALGVAQMQRLPAMVKSKRLLADRYKTTLANVKGISFVTEPDNSESIYWLNAVMIDEDDVTERDRVLKETNEAGFMTRPAWTLMHKLPMYQQNPRGDVAVAESIARRLINIPSSARHMMGKEG